MNSLGLHLYPSPMMHESRLFRFATSLVGAEILGSLHLVGMSCPTLPAAEEHSPGVQIVRLGSATKASATSVNALRLPGWYARVWRSYARRRVAVVSAHSVWGLPLAWALSRRTGAALVYNAHELETETPTMKGRKQQLARAIERALVRRCDVVSVVNQAIADWYESSYGVVPTVVRNIPLDEPRRSAHELRRRLGVSDEEVLFVHTGHLVDGRNIKGILQAFKSIPDKHVLFLGDGPLRDLVGKASAATPNIHWLPPVPTTEVVEHVREGDAALCLIETEALSYALSSPNKLFEGLAARRPVLCTELVEARRHLGPLADRWVISDVERGLGSRLQQVTRADTAEASIRLPSLPSWLEEFATLLDRYREVVAGRRVE